MTTSVAAATQPTAGSNIIGIISEAGCYWLQVCNVVVMLEKSECVCAKFHYYT